MNLTQPEILCPKCGQPVPNNRDREISDLTLKLGRGPTEEELASLSGRRRKMSLLGCEACFAKVAVPREKKPPLEDRQMPITAPAIYIK